MEAVMTPIQGGVKGHAKESKAVKDHLFMKDAVPPSSIYSM
jgi:hypothetical protein